MPLADGVRISEIRGAWRGNYGALASAADAADTRTVKARLPRTSVPSAARQLVVTLLLALVVAPAGAARPGTRAGFTQFVLPSKNIGCAFASPDRYVKSYSLRCDILSGLRPEPRGAAAACELDLTGLSLSPKRRGTVTCAGDTAVDRRSRVLRYGQSWRGGPFTCRSRITGLTCTSRAGHGIFLSRQRWRVW